MNNAFQKMGICFSFNRNTLFAPQIPCAQDVLFALGLSGHEKYYSFCRENYVPYINNVYLAAVAVSFEVMAMWPSDEVRAWRFIAETIMDMCPDGSRCLFNNEFVAAQEILVGRPAPSRGVDDEAILNVCTCPECRETKRLRALSTD